MEWNIFMGDDKGISTKQAAIEQIMFIDMEMVSIIVKSFIFGSIRASGCGVPGCKWVKM